MQTSLNTSKWYQNLWAALIFFTRLPFWRLYQPPGQSYKAVVEFWPLVGWLTGGTMAAILYFGPMAMPHALAVAVAIVARLLMTGALHEDGLADFFDGFGGGNTRQRILDIMKDSHIGTYGGTESEAKARVVYRKVSIAGGIALAFQGLLPAIPLLLYGGMGGHIELLLFIPCIVMYFLYLKIWHTLKGYTGDCCGAMFLLVELSVYLTAVIG